MPGSSNGAQRASRRSHIRALTALFLVATVLGSLAAAPTVGATTAGTYRIASVTTLTTTTIDRPWYTIEGFYFGLVNCTRTGGWVQRDGTCLGYGSGRYSAYVRPLARSYSIADKVSRPYAKLLAVRNLCSHFADHDPGYRLRRVGYTHYTWGENIGCRDGYSSAKAAVLSSHLYFQAEKSYGGHHYLNLINPRFTHVGVGIWREGGRNWFVTDFWGSF